jgi:cytochrome b
LIAVCLHLLGVAVSSLLHRENLVKSMIDGSKRDS